MAIPAEKVYLEADRIGGPIPVEALSAGETRQIVRENVAVYRATQAVEDMHNMVLIFGANGFDPKRFARRVALAAVRAFLGQIDSEGNLVVARENLEDERD